MSDSSPGIRRLRRGRSFTYIGPHGKTVVDPEVLARIRGLVIPPAWTDVWISVEARGHIQATGRDARGRKQYRYHVRWRAVRDETKFTRLVAFGRALPSIRRRVKRGLASPGITRQKVLATIVHLLDRTFSRIGNPEYARTNGSFGLTTLRDRHASFSGSSVRLRFRGKNGKEHDLDLNDRCLARIVKRCRDIPGYQLFQYLDRRGTPRTIESGYVNRYIREITGEDFTAKDFRTWGGTARAAATLRECGKFRTRAEAKRNVVRSIEAVASLLGNTPAISRKSYVHPAVLECYLEGTLARALRVGAKAGCPSVRGLSAEEAAVLAMLERRDFQEKKAEG
ncbi:MAG TPA: DNA topoisomerase IB [Planctomycetota bacterium]|nr:DNA topoisomerase IB [Planctomycetota bacterium]